MKRLILCDFDGTISLEDITYLLVRHFCKGHWESIAQEFTAGKITSQEAYHRIAEMLKGEEREVRQFLRHHGKIDPTFSTFYQYCRQKGIDLKILSDGLDFYIKTILEAHQLSEIPFYANECHFLKDGKIKISFLHANEECGLCGTCKKRLVQILRKDYDLILFVGNGFSDRCAAKEADWVFAKGSLYRFCIEKDISCSFFKDFGEILHDFKKRLRGIIFDLDGTLIEAYEAIYLGLQEAFRHFKRESFPFEDLKNYLKPDLESTLRQFFSPEEAMEGIPIMRKRYEEVYLDKTRFLDGAKEVLDSLFSKGILLGVASNKLGRFSRGALAHLGVSHYFKSIVGAGDVPRNKPFPDMIEAVLREMELLPEEAVFVGDTLTDIETGKQAGIDVFALPTGFHSKIELSKGKPKRILNSLKDLLQEINPLSSLHPPVS